MVVNHGLIDYTDTRFLTQEVFTILLPVKDAASISWQRPATIMVKSGAAVFNDPVQGSYLFPLMNIH
ncbi:hypothetical protein [Moorella stamsii]|uniref:hypothetical protein n=1 Tax=Neomoorella stamsii TaxID=1266720 RepID=UPI0006D55781|nr:MULTISPECIES: hypothetical protein [Moorella]